jgi:hypothetical protein
MAVKGIDKLDRRLKEIPPQYIGGIDAVLREGANRHVSLSKTLCPKEHGDLNDSIVATPLSEAPIAHSQGGGGATGDIGYRTTAGNSKVRYAHLVEFGAKPHIAGGLFEGAPHPGAPAQPFFYPAYRALKGSIKARLNKVLRGAAKSHAGTL